MRLPTTITCLLALCLIPSATRAGLGRIDAGTTGVFTKDRCSVIVAKVERAWQQQSPAGDRQDKAILRPLATIAGTFDPSIHPSLAVEFYSGGGTTSIRRSPHDGDTVLAVVRVQVLVQDDPVARNIVVSEVCTFMPERSALVVIKGLDDPAVTQTLTRIQEARTAAAKPKPAEQSDPKLP
jgi:hypothetical protein